jgi:hypothetical protein
MTAGPKLLAGFIEAPVNFICENKRSRLSLYELILNVFTAARWPAVIERPTANGIEPPFKSDLPASLAACTANTRILVMRHSMITPKRNHYYNAGIIKIKTNSVENNEDKDR